RCGIRWCGSGYHRVRLLHAGSLLFYRTWTTGLFTLSLHDALPISAVPTIQHALKAGAAVVLASHLGRPGGKAAREYSLRPVAERSEEHTSELQSRRDRVCRLVLEKKRYNRSAFAARPGARGLQ